MANPRKLATDALVRVRQEGAFSNLVLNAALKEHLADASETAFASACFYGVLERMITLEYLLSQHMKTPFCKVSPYTAAVLELALYQILYMDKVPDSAAVNEAVRLVKASKERYNAGFVNAVLRAFLRNATPLPNDDSAASLSIRYSCGQDIVENLLADYGFQNTKGILEESLNPPKIALRVNTLKISGEMLKQRLESNGIQTFFGAVENSLILEKGMNLVENACYREGLFHVQDMASQIAVGILAPKPYERVLDLCAAPGGKSFTMAQKMENQGELLAFDLYENRVGLIANSAKRLGIHILKTGVADASVFRKELGSFDRVLCDVPCSGLGVMRRKPEIKYKAISGMNDLPDLQYAILKNAGKYLKPGGSMLYSTCTLRRAENEKVVNRFLMEYNGFHKRHEHTFLPHMDKTDGFYCALIVKE